MSRWPLHPCMAWSQEVLAAMEVEPSETDPRVPSGIREDGIVLIRLLELHVLPPVRSDFVRGLALCSGNPDNEDRFARTVRQLEAVGLLRFNRARVESTAAALRFHRILRAAHELRRSRQF